MQRTGFALPVSDIETLNLTYKTPMHLMAELKQLGASNPLLQQNASMLTPTHLASAISAYERPDHSDKTRIEASLDIIWMSGWAPDKSQQQPLKPGSAKISLTKILGTQK